MEGRKFYATPFGTSTAKSEQERRMIAVCNAARIGTAKGMNKYHPTRLSKEDFEDAMSDAVLNSLLHVNDSTTGISYANKCGYSSALKACIDATKKAAMTTRVEESWNEEDGWNVSREVFKKELEENTMKIDLEAEEEQSIAAFRESLIKTQIMMLPKEDQIMIELRGLGLPFKEISNKMGCSIGSIQKRSYDCKKRFTKLLDSCGYYGLL
jgi:DNA-directed RNA polymerase specialized sigma24 family protein